MKEGFFDLQSRVINRGLCTACGTCAGVCPRRALAFEDLDGEPVPGLTGECVPCGICFRVCPGEDIPITDLERQFLGGRRGEDRRDIGVYKSTGYGYAVDNLVHAAGAGGGLGTALLIYALKNGVIDCAIVAGFDREKPYRTRSRIAATPEEILEAAQSKYAGVPVNERLGEAVERGYSRIGVIGLPCHIHGLRKTQSLGQPAGIARAVQLAIGLLCASEFYFEGTRHLLKEWCRIDDLDEIESLEYRGGGWPGHFVGMEVGRKTKSNHPTFG